ncbi:alpha/beta hydrolase family esterase [Winogradskya humida]|uniref:Polyhydroxybutyrate depolymerase n=1 Tax=Winogradskya humida TaxID=113566 RepID=A0ABQ3ZRE5_9ACTN|nr:PHB depolymerase family esterase [Actinoplanes humidus]GIE21132.1 hypothetical protein Ahu01nite_042340 [Actinoplanes humidus]
MTALKRAALLCLLALTPAACTPAAPPPAPPPGRTTGTLTINGQERTFRLYRPATATKKAPLVVMLHGAAGTGRQAEATYGWNATADRNGFIVAYPDGLHRTWNISPDCCGAAARDNVNDIAFITALVAAIPSTDPTRTYATGISNGAMLTYRLACDTTLFAAIAPVAGTMINACPTPTPISLIHIHGTTDRTIPYAGGPGKRTTTSTPRLPTTINGPAVPALLATWRRTAHCPLPTTATAGTVTTVTATCPHGRAVELITIENAGHQWPGATSQPMLERLLHLDAPSTALDATPTIWNFFVTHPKLTSD